MNNIILIGFMGSGKTAVGKLLSKKLNKKLIDTDDLIEEKLRMKIDDVFLNYGEEYFRDIESSICQTLKEYENKIISCGGGIILRDENVKNLKEAGRVILLQVSFAKVIERIAKETHRPLLKVQDKEKTIRDLLEFRKVRYEKAADIVIDTNNLSIQEVADKIMASMGLGLEVRS